MCLGNYESAGKRKTGKTRQGDQWLRAALIETARASARAPPRPKDDLGALYARLARRRGKKQAALPVGHAILVIACYMLTRQTDSVDVGAGHSTDATNPTLPPSRPPSAGHGILCAAGVFRRLAAASGLSQQHNPMGTDVGADADQAYSVPS
jgi:Transposase IS116/IS110/IS902 family